METSPPSLLPLLTTAAELRAAGGSWLKVAEQVGRSAETCRHWPRRFPETWRRLYRDAENHLIAEAGAEARTILRQLLRATEAKVALAAAQLLLRCRDQQRSQEEQAERPSPSQIATEITELAKFLKGLTDAQLATHLDDFLAHRHSPAVGTTAGTPDRPGPQQPE
jgi:hypothetical protein